MTPTARPLSSAAAAAAAAVALAAAVSTPSLCRPFGHGLVVLVLMPALLAIVFGLVGRVLTRLPWLRSAEGSVAVAVAALLGAAPWLLAAGSDMARHPWAGWLGWLVALVLALVALRRGGRVPLLLLVVAVVLVAGRPAPDLTPSDQTIRPLVVVGIDAGTWDQIDPLIEAGELPNLAWFRDHGATGELTSEVPTMSPRIWTILATGLTSDENGIHDFESVRHDLKTGRFWDAAAEAGSKVGLVEWHMTWPPDERPGFGVPGWLARGFETLPVEAGFLKRLEAAGKGRSGFFSLSMLRVGFNAVAVSAADNLLLHLGAFAKIIFGHLDAEDSYWHVKLVQARLKTDTYLELMAREKAELSAVIVYPVDSLGHNYWRYHEPERFAPRPEEEIARFRDVIPTAYRTADKSLGDILARFDLSRTTVAIVSDHGMEASEEHATGRVHGKRLVAALGLEGTVRHAVAGRRLFLSTELPPGPERLALLKNLHRTLSEARLRDAGGTPFLLDPFDESADTLGIELRPGKLKDVNDALVLNGVEIPVTELFHTEHRSGSHTVHGIVGLVGPGIQAGARIEGAGIYDFAPTMLYAMGLPVPEDLPGEVITSAWTTEALAARPPESIPGGLPDPPPARQLTEMRSVMESNLQELGYTDGEDE